MNSPLAHQLDDNRDNGSEFGIVIIIAIIICIILYFNDLIIGI